MGTKFNVAAIVFEVTEVTAVGIATSH